MESETQTTANTSWVDREYIHTPGYVDEYVCETDRNDVPLYHMQDANFNVVGIVNAAGAMLRQYTLDPDGRVIRTEQFLDHVPSRLGHQGLFFDRLDAGITSGGLLPNHLGVTESSGSNTDTPWLGAYQNRNRTYLPQYRRFGQGDPNGTGIPLTNSMAFHGGLVALRSDLPDTSSLFANGPNRYMAYGSGPLGLTDPSGLDYSLGSLMMSNAILGAQWGFGVGAIGGAIQAGMQPGATTWSIAQGAGRGAFFGMAAGMSGGALGGAGLYMLGGSATSVGLAGGLGLGGLISMGGTAIGSPLQQYADTGTVNLNQVMSDMSWSGILGTITGGLGGVYNARQARLAADEAALLGGSSMGRASALDLIASSQRTRSSSVVRNYQVNGGGGWSSAADWFERLTGQRVTGMSAMGGVLDDGSRISLYPASNSTGGPTISIQQAQGGMSLKFRF